MATCFMEIEKDTASSSKFNSREVRKEILKMDKKIYDYTKNLLFEAQRSRINLSRQLTNFQSDEMGWQCVNSGYPVFCDATVVCRIASPTYNVSTTVSSYSLEGGIHLDIGQLTELLRVSKQLLKVEEEAEEFKALIFDDYSIDGISIYSKEAIEFQARMKELRKKYGITA